MPRVIDVLILAGMVLAAQTGCATYTAIKMPGPTGDENVDVGMHRSDVEGVLGVGPTSEYENEGLQTVRYEYSDGPTQWSKLRSVLYVGADVFTLFLSELIFFPTELYATDRIKRVATAEYDDENELVEWKVQRRGGETLEHKGSSGIPAEGVPIGDEQSEDGATTVTAR
ncbi:MAG: hypothetical protein QNK03_28590 [Myxococcota bacterium]|nr:hypothetical protein [Myxococcota bacterium]